MIGLLPLLMMAANAEDATPFAESTGIGRPTAVEEIHIDVISPEQERFDLSMSPLPIDTRFVDIEHLLSKIVEDDCEEWGECEWRNADGVRHYFWDDRLVLKFVKASEFEGRPISAFGLGMTRERGEVIAKIRQFLPGIDLDCEPAKASGNVGPDECAAFLGPGWFQVGFGSNGQLETIRFDGYHFT